MRGPAEQPALQKHVRVLCSSPVIACDGAGSRIRYALRHQGLTKFSEQLLSRGYKEVLHDEAACLTSSLHALAGMLCMRDAMLCLVSAASLLDVISDGDAGVVPSPPSALWNTRL